jgi:hypothetical protein
LDRQRHKGRDYLTVSVRPREHRSAEPSGFGGDVIREEPRVATARWVVVLHSLSLLIAGAVLLRVNRRQWFFGDEWAYLTDVASHRVDLFAPHNEHWQTVPKLVYWLLVELFGVRSYLPYTLLLVAAHLVVAHLLWRIALRAGAEPFVATVLVGVFALLGAGAENLLWAFQLGFLFSLLFGFVGVLLVDHDDRNVLRDLAAAVAGLVAVMSSGIGVPMVVVVAMVTWLRRGLITALRISALPGVAFLLWFLTQGRDSVGTTTSITLESLLQVPRFAWFGLTSSLDRAVGMDAVGAVIVGGLVVFGVRRATVRGPSQLAAVGAVGVLLMYCFIGVGRTGLGVEEAAATRYSYIALALLLPLVALAVTWVVSGIRAPLVVTSVLGVLLLAQNVDLLRQASGDEAEREQAVKGQILAAASLLDSGEPVLAVRPEPKFDPDITVDNLRQMAAAGWLPPLRFSERDLLDARVHLQVAAAADRLPAPVEGPTPLVASARVELTQASAPDCLLAHPTEADPQIVVDGSRPVSLRLDHASGSSITVFLRDPADATTVSDGLTVPLAGSGRTRLQLATRDVQAIVTLPRDGDTLVCGVSR